MKTISWLLLISMIFFSCTSTHMVMRSQSAYYELNHKLKGHKVKTTLMNGEIVAGENINLAIDSTSWVATKWKYAMYGPDIKTSIPWVVPTSDIEKIDVKNRSQGVLGGIGYGFLAGAALGVLFAIPLSQAKGISRGGKTGAGAFVAVPIFGVAGIIYGIPIGYLIGGKDEYILSKIPIDSTSNYIEVEEN